MQADNAGVPKSIRRPCAASRFNEQGLGLGYLKVPFARCTDGVARHVSAVSERSLGPFKCLDCEQPLLLRRPKSKRAHFSHRADSICNGETALHRYAKELLALRKTLTLPPLVLQESGLTETVSNGGVYVFDEVRLEFRLETFQPDAIALHRSHKLAVEFRVSHAVDVEKKYKVLAHNLSMVEIDLSEINAGHFSFENLDEAILHSAPRKWIHHRNYRAAITKLESRVSAQQAERGEQLRTHIEKKVHAVIPKDWLDEASVLVDQEHLGHLVDLEVDCGHWFSVPRAVWQAQVLSVHLIEPGKRFKPGGDGVEIEGEWPNERNLASKLPSWMIRSDLDHYPPERLQEAGYDQESYGSPHSAVWHYLAKLCRLREAVVWSAESKKFIIDPELHGRLYRRSEFRTKARKIFDAIQYDKPESEYLIWVSSYSVGGITIASIIEEGGAEYLTLLGKISAVVAMLPSHSRRIADDLCGLPLEHIRERNLAAISADSLAKQQKETEFANGRRATIKRRATIELEQDAVAWLDSLVEPEGVSVVDFASISDATLLEAERRLATEAIRRRQAISKAERVNALRSKLVSAAQRAYGDQVRAELFLNSGQPRIGGHRPIDYCCCEKSLKLLLTLLQKRR
jgi:hypothetical protein